MARLLKWGEFQSSLNEGAVSKNSAFFEIEKIINRVSSIDFDAMTRREKEEFLLRLQAVDGDIDLVDNIHEKYQRPEKRESRVDESGIQPWYITGIEYASAFLGNATFIDMMVKGLEKITGKKYDVKSVENKVADMFLAIRDAGHWFNHQFENAVTMIASKVGVPKTGSVALGKAAMAAVVVTLLWITVENFPVGNGPGDIFAILVTITAIVGKVYEIVKLIRQMIGILFNPKDAPNAHITNAFTQIRSEIEQKENEVADNTPVQQA
jgi:hypothetical protein